MESKTLTPGAAPPAEIKRAAHGLYVRGLNGRTLRDHKVQRMVRRMMERMPWLKPSDVPVARHWAQLEIIGDQCYAALRTMGAINPETGEIRRLVDDFRRLRATQMQLENSLGMTPASRVAMKGVAERGSFDLVSALRDQHNATWGKDRDESGQAEDPVDASDVETGRTGSNEPHVEVLIAPIALASSVDDS